LAAREAAARALKNKTALSVQDMERKRLEDEMYGGGAGHN
jgi:hypothetical protein